MVEMKEKETEYPVSQPLFEKEIEKIIYEYEKELRFLVFRYVRDWISVDDIMQEVYLKVFLKMDSFENRSTLKSWLYSITRNQCFDFLRSKTIKSTLLMENLEELKVTNINSAEFEAFKKLEKERLYVTINSLPIQYRQPLILHYFNYFTYKEISELLNKEISFIKNNIFRGRRLLKEKYSVDQDI
ncbi:RNA polymerase sigma factor [Metabacillus herbersteinensis]|uniref:RNA polymerase sigma factor n=1 Tax=Metabacillus herbersteinensis TaxID=283816 RepID=A0ABV6GPR3_9BACI